MIFIHKSSKYKDHSRSWSLEWERYCIKNNLKYTTGDIYNLDLAEIVEGFSFVLFELNNFVEEDLRLGKSIIKILESSGMKVFPNYDEIWHYDDKISQSLAFHNHPNFPNFKIILNKQVPDVKTFPIVFKTSNGSGSHGVKLISNKNDLENTIKANLTGRPSFLFKLSSNLTSLRSFSDFYNRLIRVPEFIRTLRKSKKVSINQNIGYLQEYIDNNGFDIKLVYVYGKITFVKRYVRPNDFRASGSGNLSYDPSDINEDILNMIRDICIKNNYNCMGFDVVIDKYRNPKIIEISYSFDWPAQFNLGWHYDENNVIINNPLHVPDEIIKNNIKG